MSATLLLSIGDEMGFNSPEQFTKHTHPPVDGCKRKLGTLRVLHAMSLPDAQEWAEAYDKEYMGMKQRNVFGTVRMEKGMKLMGMTTQRSKRYPTAYSASATGR